MRRTIQLAGCIFFSVMFLLAAAPLCHALTPGREASLFALHDINGNRFDLSSMKKSPMMVIYFFDIQSRPSLEGLSTLDGLLKKHKGSDLTVWAITRSSRPAVASFIAKTAPSFPILIDDANVSDLYNAGSILPVSCITGPDLKVLDYFQGGGKTMNAMLLRLAERKLQQRDTVMARAISDNAASKNPGDENARVIKGYALLKEGKMKEAEAVFSALAKGKGRSVILGKEGLAAIYAQKGETGKALSLAREVQKKAPDRAYPHIIEADILAAQNKKKEAKAKYEAALAKSGSEPYQKAVAYNKLGRLSAGAKDYQGSRDLYDKAIELDPYYVEAMTNKGVAYEKEGKWDQALASYEQGRALGARDSFSNVLAARAVEMIEYRKDSARKEHVDSLVKELAERYRAQSQGKKKRPADSWTSPPMVMCLADFTETGSFTDRDGVSTVLSLQLAEQLKSSGRVQVVDRLILDKLLEELNIGSSGLADTETSLKLGRVLTARMMGIVATYLLPEGAVMKIRLVDTETTSIVKIISVPMPFGMLERKDLNKVNREILETVMKEYPLRAYVIDVNNGEAIVNLGKEQGVVAGTTFDALGEEQEGIEYKGKKIKGKTEVVGKLEVVRTEPEISYCRIVNQKRWIGKDDRLMESLQTAQ